MFEEADSAPLRTGVVGGCLLFWGTHQIRTLVPGAADAGDVSRHRDVDGFAALKRCDVVELPMTKYTAPASFAPQLWDSLGGRTLPLQR